MNFYMKYWMTFNVSFQIIHVENDNNFDVFFFSKALNFDRI